MMDAALHRGVLGIEGETDAADIGRRYRALMKRCHPDRAPWGREGEFLERAKDLNAARAWLLKNPSSWKLQVPVASPTQPGVAMRESGAIGTSQQATRRSATSWVMVAMGLYVGLLAFAVVGWVLSALLGG